MERSVLRRIDLFFLNSKLQKKSKSKKVCSLDAYTDYDTRQKDATDGNA